jgi:hypothetical protein
MEIANDDIIIIEVPIRNMFKFKASRATVKFSDFTKENGPQELDKLFTFQSQKGLVGL